jgi:hypothetical protein
MPDQSEPPHWNIDSHYFVPEGEDDVTGPVNDVIAFQLILANSLSDFLYSGKVWIIIILRRI